MALQPFQDSQALALLEQITPEEQEKRQKDAEELEKKLTYIVEELPDRTYHVMGSNAGAGSGEFHTYRNARRREQDRLARMERDYKEALERKAHEEKQLQLQREDEERTAKNRAKRQKKKEKQKAKKLAKTAGMEDTGEAAQQQGRGDGSAGSGSGSDEGAGGHQHEHPPPVEQAELD